MTKIEMDQRVATLRLEIMKQVAATGERNVSIVIAALAECLGRVSMWNLEAELKATSQQ